MKLYNIFDALIFGNIPL